MGIEERAEMMGVENENGGEVYRKNGMRRVPSTPSSLYSAMVQL